MKSLFVCGMALPITTSQCFMAVVKPEATTAQEIIAKSQPLGYIRREETQVRELTPNHSCHWCEWVLCMSGWYLPITYWKPSQKPKPLRESMSGPEPKDANTRFSVQQALEGWTKVSFIFLTSEYVCIIVLCTDLWPFARSVCHLAWSSIR